MSLSRAAGRSNPKLPSEHSNLGAGERTKLHHVLKETIFEIEPLSPGRHPGCQNMLMYQYPKGEKLNVAKQG